MANFFALYSNFGSQVAGILVWLVPTIIFLIVAGFILYLAMQRKLYRFPVTIFSERENGAIKEIETRGAFIARKGSSPFFRIKLGTFKYRDLLSPPKLEGLTPLNRIYYYQKDIDTFIQLKRQVSDSIVNFVPVEADIKYGAILSIQRIRDVLRKENKLEKYIAPVTIIVGLMLIAVMFYFMLDKFNPDIMARVAEQTARAAEALAKARAAG